MPFRLLEQRYNDLIDAAEPATAARHSSAGLGEHQADAAVQVWELGHLAVAWSSVSPDTRLISPCRYGRT